jgi:hypothetical protein
MTTGTLPESTNLAVPTPDQKPPRELLPFTGSLPYFPDGQPADYKPPQLPDEPISPKTILFAWELGGGLGHLMQMLPLAQDLAKAGHRVFVALKELHHAGEIFGRAGVRFLQAPLWTGKGPSFPLTLTFTQILLCCGFESVSSLYPRACAWRNLFLAYRPNLVIFDHAPTALLVSADSHCNPAAGAKWPKVGNLERIDAIESLIRDLCAQFFENPS